ncbi:MAG: pyrophosphokinae [Myxococcaceae bacterium]|nr:pyrophosphokinae [Myxococcaceae bacterium]
MSTLERAISIAATAHTGQLDKAGLPYILHPLRMMLKMKGNEERIAAVLHDVVEDTPWTLQSLRAEGFSEPIIQAVDSLTHRADEDYESFVRRAARDAIAARVKRADLEDNSDLSRLPNPSARDLERLEKYKRALQVLDALVP